MNTNSGHMKFQGCICAVYVGILANIIYGGGRGKFERKRRNKKDKGKSEVHTAKWMQK
jgi:hypothetical protein